ncbi:MAG TPA: hypothetical protein VG367_17995 [Mucilaginibacter sp.]|jgi:hypothetical protein|nr:hypothetical protein [Mucilaginibacter sp.]
MKAGRQSSDHPKKNRLYKLNGVTIIPASEKFDPKEMRELITGKNIDAKKLREDAWKRKGNS